MLLPGFVRKLSAVFRGNVAPPLIVLTTLFGFWFGMTPGWTGLHTAMVVIVLVLNVHLALFMLSLAVGKAISLAIAPLLYHTGIWVQSSLGGLLTFLSSIPIIGLTDFSQFAVSGALILGPAVGLVAGLIMAFLVIRFRRVMMTVDQKSEKFRKWYSHRIVRFMDWLIIGKRTKDVQSMFKKAVYLRKVGIALAVIVVGAFLLAMHFLQGSMVKSYATGTLGHINGAEVDLAKLNISVLAGSVSAENFQMTDAKKPQQDQLVIEKMSAAASVYDLTLGRLVMDKVELTGMKFGQARQAAGQIFEKPPEPPADPCKYAVDIKDMQKLDKYVKDAQQVKEWLQKLSTWLPKSKKDAPAPAQEEKPTSYLQYLTAKALSSPSAKVWAKQILADKVAVPSSLFGNSKIEVLNLSDVPRAINEPVTLQMKSNETNALLKATMDYSKSGPPVITGTFEGFDMGKLQSLLGNEAGVAFQSGAASGTFTGQLTSDTVDLTINLSMKNLQAKGEGKGLLNLGAGKTTEIMQALSELGTTIRVVGPTSDPRLVFDTKGLTDQFNSALVKAGKEKVQTEMTSAIEKNLGNKVPTQLKDTVQKGGQGLVEGLGGLLGGNKKADPNKK
jgi:uncharacterized protein (TIGR03546 family)